MGDESLYSIVFAPDVSEHVRAIDRKCHRLIRQQIDDQLQHDPDVATRNRKPLRQPAALNARWELRFGPDNRFRVLYVIDPQRREVLIVAVGVKKGNRLIVGRKEIDL